MSGLQILNRMFGYDTPIPDAPTTRQHRIGVYSSGFKRTEKEKEREEQQKALNELDGAIKRARRVPVAT